MTPRITACGHSGFRPGGGAGPAMAEAAACLLRDYDIRPESVDAVIVSSNEGGGYLGPILAEGAGIRPGAAHRVENLCSSGAGAIVSAYAHVASGLAGSVLVCGADAAGGPGLVLDWDATRGAFSSPVYWASILASSYKRRFGATAADLAVIPARNSANAVENPHALPGAPRSVDDVLSSRGVTDDLRLYECSRSCTGAAAVLVASGPGDGGARITGIGQATASASFAGGPEFAPLASTAEAAAAALSMAGRGPGEVGVAEVHDAFSVCEPMALEAAGICAPGTGAAYAREMLETCSRRINPRGGLLGSGHPPGATGVAQAAEIFLQVCGRAGRRQADSASCGMIHNMSAAGTSSSVIVMEA